MHTGQPKRNSKPKNIQKTTVRLSQRQLLLIGGAVSTLVIVLIVLFYQSTRTTPARAAVLGDYRSKSSGTWNNTGTWETYNGSAWVNAGATPTSANNVITIQNGHTVVLSASITADQLVIEAGARLNINGGRTLTMNNGSGTELENYGTIGNSGSISLNSGSNIIHHAAALYQHSQNGGTIPTAAWNASSTCNITGITGTLPANITQNFGHLIWNCPSQSSNICFNANLSIQGNFTVISTGTRYLGLSNTATARSFAIGGNFLQSGGDFRGTNSSGTATISVNGDFNLSGSTATWFTATSGSGACNTSIGGNLNISNGVFWVNEDINPCSLSIGGSYFHSDGVFIGTDATGTSTVTIGGDLQISGNTASSYCIGSSGGGLCTMSVSGQANISGGNLLLTEGTANGILNVAGNFSYTGGYIWENSVANSGEINFNGTTTQLCTATTDVFYTIHFTVKSNAFLQMAGSADYLNGDGNFTLEAGAKLGIRSADGISAGGPAGHIRVGGSRNFSNAADYEYNGSSAQLSGNGLPATVRDFIMNNSAGLTLSYSFMASDSLILSAGNIITSSNTISLGTTPTATGGLQRISGHIVGNFQRWMASATASAVLFPVGTLSDYNGIQLDVTTAPAGGTITSSFSTGFPGVYGLPITDAGDPCSTIGSGWWTLTAGNGFSGGSYDIAVVAEGFSGISDYTSLHLFRRDDNASLWTASGTHVAPSGSAASPVVHRSGLSQLGEFSITSTTANPLPVALTSFQVKAGKGGAYVRWSTGTEKNSDYFKVERSADARSFQEIATVKAAGNSTSPRQYESFDDAPLSGISYYRLVQVDLDGTKELFGPLPFRHSAQGPAAFSTLKASPNPFRSDLSLSFESALSGQSLMLIRDQKGQEVYRGSIDVKEGQNTISFPLADQLPAGTYILSLGEGSSRIHTRVIKL